jgi:hypothetical protein
LEPPASAVISSRLALGESGLPIVCHQRRMLSTAKAAVSWSVPTLTQASFWARS